MYKSLFAMGAGMLLLSACSEQPANHLGKVDLKGATQVIYGEDDRVDLYDVKDARIKEMARSTMALVQGYKLRENENGYELQGANYGDSMNLCSGERFTEQDSVAYCSGALIGPDLVLTAGHCIETCGNEKFVFDFNINHKGDNPNLIPKTSVYSCEEVVARELEYSQDGVDYAIVRLDREVLDRKPLEYRTKGRPRVGDELYVIGHPTGLPTKFADGASVREYGSHYQPYFVANLDTYGGNSGSAVFNARTHQIEGVLVRGEDDFVMRGSCKVSVQCEDDACMGEHVTKISTVMNSF